MPKAPPASPPKRMTRGRAKALEEKQQTQVITTAGARAATAASKAPAKRKAREEDELATSEALDGRDIEKNKKAPAKPQPKQSTRGKAKQPKEEPTASQDELETATQPRTRTTTDRAAAVKKSTGGASIPTRPTKAQTTTRSTRPKATEQPASSQVTRNAATRKKVTFQDDQNADKENAVETESHTKAGKIVKEKAGTTMSKAPKRGNAASAPKSTRATTSKRVPANTQPTEPLSPKKVTQVAKASPTDEGNKVSQALEQSPRKNVAHTPIKQLSPSNGKDEEGKGEHAGSPADELQLPGTASPIKQSRGPLVSSPPKRPPQSPTKVSLKDSPKKLNIGTPAIKTSISQHDEVQASASLIQSPARKPPSPIKMFRDIPRQASQQTPASTSKTLLLGTPARRPPFSVKAMQFPLTAPRPGHGDHRPDVNVSALKKNPQKFKIPIVETPSKVSKFHESATSPTKLPQIPDAEQDEEQDELLSEETTIRAVPLTPRPTMILESKAVTSHELGQEHKTNPRSVNALAQKPPQPLDRQCDDACDGTQEENPEVTTTSAGEPQRDAQTSPLSTVASELQPPPVQWSPVEDSEDELMSEDPKYLTSPSRKAIYQSSSIVPVHAQTPIPNMVQPIPGITMTGLAERFGAWAGATPDGNVLKQRETVGFVFSPIKQPPQQQAPELDDSVTEDSVIYTPVNNFAEAMDIHEDGSDMIDSAPIVQEDLFRQSHISDASQEYGDENAIPIDPAILHQESRSIQTCTPQRIEKKEAQVVHTVSKVPLKPAADVDISPRTRAAAKKRQSVATALTPRADLDLQAFRQVYPPRTSIDSVDIEIGQMQSSEVIEKGSPQPAETPRENSRTWSVSRTPARTPRPNLNNKLLSGAIVFVDVHTTEGADASEIFVELLQQMGATVRNSWNWNPEKTNDSDVEDGDSRPGITHVVFKDGGKRTMEKVRMAKGVVVCVGVGWVLDCERENKWLDEADYSIDASFVPRGGHRRRKSMEPKMFANLNGTLSSSATPNRLTASLSPPGTISPSKASQAPAKTGSRRVTIAAPSPSPKRDIRDIFDKKPPVASDKDDSASPEMGRFVNPAEIPLPATPARPGMLTGGDNSPTTPYFLHADDLEQKTCPPKQSQQTLFPLSGKIEDQIDESLRQRLMNARRKSLQFAPKVKSPLSRGFNL